MSSESSVEASAESSSAGEIAFADFSDPGVLTEILVFDEDGHLIPNVTITSASGAAYPYPYPDASTAVIWGGPGPGQAVPSQPPRPSAPQQ